MCRFSSYALPIKHQYYHILEGHIIWLFANFVAGANASANLYSLVETAKANGHEPYAYLCPMRTSRVG